MSAPPTPTAVSARFPRRWRRSTRRSRSIPTIATPCSPSGAILRDAGRDEEALAVADRLLARDAGDAAAHVARAGALAKLKRFDEALAAADAAVRVAPKDPEAHTGARHRARRARPLRRSVEALETADGSAPPAPIFTIRAAVALGECRAASTRRWPPTIGDRGGAGRCDSATTTASFVLLTLGDYDEGWAEHEWRLKTRNSIGRRCSRWRRCGRARTSPARRCCSIPSRAHGDTIQFVRYAPAGRGARRAA